MQCLEFTFPNPYYTVATFTPMYSNINGMSAEVVTTMQSDTKESELRCAPCCLLPILSLMLRELILQKDQGIETDEN